jgi:hypothetical protein
VVKRIHHSCKEINELFATENVTVGNLLSVNNTSWLSDEPKAEVTAGVQKITTEMLVVVNENCIFFLQMLFH